ncbi:MAG: hypothetical protein HRU09_10295 [Oligoflexales bacterium]|nr:hypothetical protein [Oligoflexales bacterium]
MLNRHSILAKLLYYSIFSSIIIGFLGNSDPAPAGIHFTLQSSLSENNFLLTSQNSRSGSASIAFDLGTYFRIGLTHRQAVNQSRGHFAVSNTDPKVYEYKEEETHVFSNSLDFTIILYYGRLFVPYLQIGAVKKDYQLVTTTENETKYTKASFDPVPNGGIGLGVRLNRNFSLKLSLSLSPGLKQSTPEQEKAEGVWDTYTSVGISYNI